MQKFLKCFGIALCLGFGFLAFNQINIYANNTATYKVKYFVEQSSGEYDEITQLEKILNGKVDSFTNATPSDSIVFNQNYVLKPITQQKILADNSTVVNVYYDINSVKMHFIVGSEEISVQNAKIGKTFYFPTLEKKDGFENIGWFLFVENTYYGWNGLGWVGFDSLENEGLNKTNAIGGIIFNSYSDDVYVYGKYQPVSYNVVLKTDGVFLINDWVYNIDEKSYSKTFASEEEIILPEISKEGYVFEGWQKDISSTDKNQIFSPVWSNALNTTYSYEVYFQNIYDDNYSLDISLSKTLIAKANETITVTAQEYAGFSFNEELSSLSEIVNANGLTKIKLYYDRNSYSITFMLSENDENPEIKTYKFGEIITYPSLTPSTTLSVVGWQNVNMTMPNQNLVVYAEINNSYLLNIEPKENILKNEKQNTNALTIILLTFGGLVTALVLASGIYKIIKKD